MGKEIVIGLILSLVIFMGYLGYDIVPIIVLSIMGIVIYFLLERKGILKNNSVGTGMSHKPIDFNDIGGQTPAKQEIQEALEFMRKSDRFKAMGIRPLKGILLTGPPGTGKTLLAKAAATYTDSVFITASGSEFIEMYAGVGAQRVRSLFESAKKQAKKFKKNSAVIFIDEIEVLGGKRGSHSSHLEYDQTLNQLLVEMDGMKTDPELQILVMGATNRADLIDAALLRPGRFDRIVNVDLPDVTSRLQILTIHTANKPLGEDVRLSMIAKETFSFSGAQLESVCNEAAIYAMREEASFILSRHFKEAIDKVIMGEKAEKKPTNEEKRRIAIHESGHAFISETLEKNSVSYVTITSRGNALGYMRQIPASDIYLYTKDHLLKQINICLAGAVAEEILIGNKSSGSLNDFRQAVKLARQIIDCGLSNLGIVDSESIPQQSIHDEVREIIQRQEQVTGELIKGNLAVLNRMVDLLLENEYIAGEQLHELWESKKSAQQSLSA
ncbi:AAA family ATPase [Candidatus Formimonas warabiya]|nr:AAA family ATPase [Candidatus Formimonas warabiya]